MRSRSSSSSASSAGRSQRPLSCSTARSPEHREDRGRSWQVTECSRCLDLILGLYLVPFCVSISVSIWCSWTLVDSRGQRERGKLQFALCVGLRWLYLSENAGFAVSSGRSSVGRVGASQAPFRLIPIHSD